MNPGLIDAALAAGSLALYGAAYTAVLMSTRPARVRPQPATPELGGEPPAVVNLLANRWRLTEDAGESTLLDLAARGHLELRQPGSDPRETTIHLRKPAELDTLTSYELRVRNRIAALAVSGAVPVTALTFRSRLRATRWNRRLRAEVIADARARRLSRRRVPPAAAGALVAVAALSAAGVALAYFRAGLRDGNGSVVSGTVVVGLLVFGLFSVLTWRPAGERDTAAGREAATRWLGVRDWLRGHEEFADLPPAAVAVWDRYLPYGAALGATRTASGVLDLGVGGRRRVWSSYGGRWRQVRVRYPRFWLRYGRRVPHLLRRAALALVAGFVLVVEFGLPEIAPLPVPLDVTDASLLPVLAVALLAYSGYVPLRAILDLVTTRTLTGEVLWVGTWRVHYRREEGRLVPRLEYLAIDDGTSDRVTAWALPSGTTAQPRARDIVRVRVRPWTRRVVALTLERAAAHPG